MILPENRLLEYVLHLADNNLILGQRLGEWCGHGPVLEQDIALTNISLDLIGQARMYYQYASRIDGIKSEDEFAYFRDGWDFRNVLLVEQPNGHWGDTIVRQFLFDSWHFYFLDALQQSTDKELAAIAEKSIKEVTYHLRYSSEWMIRLGDGTQESHEKMQSALHIIWRFSEELLVPAKFEEILAETGVAVNLDQISKAVKAKRKDIIDRATLTIPENEYMQFGGKEGQHTEHLGYILTELQYVQRAYPGLEW